MKRVMSVCCLVLLVAVPVWAAPWFIPFEEGPERSPDRFGYKIEREDIAALPGHDRGDSVRLTITMTPEAAKAFKSATLRLYSNDTVALDAELATRDLENGGKQIALTVAKTHLKKGEIFLSSYAYNADTRIPNFAGFRVTLMNFQRAEPSAGGDGKPAPQP